MQSHQETGDSRSGSDVGRRIRQGKAITLEFEGGSWDGKSLHSDADDQEESLLATACDEMAHHGAIGAECAGLADEALMPFFLLQQLDQ